MFGKCGKAVVKWKSLLKCYNFLFSKQASFLVFSQFQNIFQVLLSERLHCGEQFTVCSILSYRALLPRILYEIQNFFTHFAFILFYLVIVKCGKICGNALKPQIGFVVCVHFIYYTHQYHPCQIETIGKKKRGTEMYPSSFIQGTHRFPHGLGIPAWCWQ